MDTSVLHSNDITVDSQLVLADLLTVDQVSIECLPSIDHDWVPIEIEISIEGINRRTLDRERL